MKVLLYNNQCLDAHVEMPADALVGCSVILYNGQHYLFTGLQGAFFTTIRFDGINPPLEIGVQPQPTPERKFMGKPRGEAL